jgi:hypothetical protein
MEFQPFLLMQKAATHTIRLDLPVVVFPGAEFAVVKLLSDGQASEHGYLLRSQMIRNRLIAYYYDSSNQGLQHRAQAGGSGWRQLAGPVGVERLGQQIAVSPKSLTEVAGDHVMQSVAALMTASVSVVSVPA